MNKNIEKLMTATVTVVACKKCSYSTEMLKLHLVFVFEPHEAFKQNVRDVERLFLLGDFIDTTCFDPLLA